MSYLIVFRTSPDVDHMSPLAWKLLKEGETVHAVMSVAYDVDGDHRLELLREFPAFHLHELQPASASPGGSRVRRLRARARATVPYALWMLRRHRVRLVAVEWGYGLPPAYDRLRSPAGAVAVLRSLAGSLVHGNEPQQPRASFIVAARVLGIPTVGLPHGLNIKLDPIPNDEIAQMVATGTLDFSDRNRFTAYVLDSEHHRRMHIDMARGDPEVMQTWGSLRWSPDWFEVNRSLAPPFAWPADGAPGLVRVVFMVPKWRNRVHAPEAIELVRRLQAVDGISLAVMGHPRSRGDDSDPLRADPGVDWSRIHDLTGRNSVSVIREADVVIDVGSSIGLEVVFQGKVLVNPAYVHELETLFDALDGVAVTASDADAVVAYLGRHVAGEPHELPAGVRDKLLREAVYGSREPFDVPGLYYRRVREMAAASHR